VSPERGLLQVDGLEVAFRRRRGQVTALHDITFEVGAGEIVGIVGESGCGKSTLAGAIPRLLPASASITGGTVHFEGRDLGQLGARELRSLRGSRIAMIFQDPLTSLNPTFRIGTQLVDAQRAHGAAARGRGSRAELRRRSVELLAQVGIPDPAERIDRFPHEFSGGMRQRIMIAMALGLEPALLIADEPTSALDVTLEAQILELLRRLRHEHGTAIVLISHDLGVVSRLCDRVIVMYAGRAVEEGDVVSVFEDPLHPYTRALLAAVPSRHRRDEQLATIPGRVPPLGELPTGCTFADRCTFVQDVNRLREPRFLAVEGRRVRCNMYDPDSGYELERPSELRT
jgi:peptide/nickel transport system ATP-binding protein